MKEGAPMEKVVVARRLEEALEVVNDAWDKNPPVDIYSSSNEIGKLVKGYLVVKVFEKLTENRQD